MGSWPRSLVVLVALAASGCEGAGGEADSGADATVDADATMDSGGDADQGDAEQDAEEEQALPEMVDRVAPEPGTVARRNRAIEVVFAGEVDRATVVVELDGEPQDLLSTDDLVFRFVPLPLWAPGAEHSVTLLAGATDLAARILEDDLSWSFSTEATEVERGGDPELTEDEVELIMAGAADEPMELVAGWEDSTSSLHEISPPLDPTSPEVAHLVARLLVSVDYHGGIGLAAPQVGVNRRVFVADVGEGFEAFLNPAILAYAEETDEMVEGCLSIPDERITVVRPRWVELEQDGSDGSHVDLRRLENPEGNPFSYPARVWLHELDHLNGILISDRAARW